MLTCALEYSLMWYEILVLVFHGNQLFEYVGMYRIKNYAVREVSIRLKKQK